MKYSGGVERVRNLFSFPCFVPLLGIEEELQHAELSVQAAFLISAVICLEKTSHLSNLFLLRRFGLVGLYKGLEAKLLQTVLTAALMFLVYEKLTAATFTVMGLKHSQKH